jgi:hypothetical protein
MPDIEFIRGEIARLRLQVLQRREIAQFQRAGIPSTSAEALLGRMLNKIDNLCAQRGSFCTTSPAIPAFTNSTKPASISASVAASCTTSSRPSALAAAACRCCSTTSVPKRGLTSKPTTCADGTIAQRSSSRLPPRSPVKKLTPVAIPGRFMLVTRPALTGSSPTRKTRGRPADPAALAARAAGSPAPTITERGWLTSSATNDGKLP